IASSGLPSVWSESEPREEIRLYSSWSAMLRRRSLNCEMSAPETNDSSPATRSTTTRMASSAVSSRTYSGMASHISRLTALRFSGWLKTIQPIGPSFCIKSLSVMRDLPGARVAGSCEPQDVAGLGPAVRGELAEDVYRVGPSDASPAPNLALDDRRPWP